MGRPTRSWLKKTYTVSALVEKAIAVRAAEQDLDPGTVVDIIIWNALVKPSEEGMKKGGLSQEMVERVFVEEVLALLDGEGMVRNLSKSLQVDPDNRTNLQQVRVLARRWRRTRSIEQKHWKAVLSLLAEHGHIPSVVRHGLVLPESLPSETPTPKYSEEEELERSFAEEALRLLESDEAIDTLFEMILLDEHDEIANLRAVERMVRRWRKAGIIDKKYRETVFNALNDGSWVPTIIKDGRVDLEWLQTEESGN